MKKNVFMILIILFFLTGCNNTVESFSQNATLYFNKNQAEAKLSEAALQLEEKNKETAKIFNRAEKSLISAIRIEEEMLAYLKDTKALNHNIKEINDYSLFYYNILVYKTHLLMDIDNGVKEIKSTELSEKEIKENVTEDILNTLKVDYFMNKHSVEQIFSYKLEDGTIRVFTLTWGYICSETNIFNYKEIIDEKNI